MERCSRPRITHSGLGNSAGLAEEEISGGDMFIDGERVTVVEELIVDDGRALSKRCFARFESGLPAGWHRLAGRWYDRGALVLTSDRSIEFVER